MLFITSVNFKTKATFLRYSANVISSLNFPMGHFWSLPISLWLQISQESRKSEINSINFQKHICLLRIHCIFLSLLAEQQKIFCFPYDLSVRFSHLVANEFDWCQTILWLIFYYSFLLLFSLEIPGILWNWQLYLVGK